jgi:hypothetical protein
VSRNLKELAGHSHMMNDEIRTILVRSMKDVGLAKSRGSVSVSRVIECQGESSVSRGRAVDGSYLSAPCKCR